MEGSLGLYKFISDWYMNVPCQTNFTTERGVQIEETMKKDRKFYCDRILVTLLSLREEIQDVKKELKTLNEEVRFLKTATSMNLMKKTGSTNQRRNSTPSSNSTAIQQTLTRYCKTEDEKRTTGDGKRTAAEMMSMVEAVV